MEARNQIRIEGRHVPGMGSQHRDPSCGGAACLVAARERRPSLPTWARTERLLRRRASHNDAGFRFCRRDRCGRSPLPPSPIWCSVCPMRAPDKLTAYLLELLAPLGPISARRMFGGVGLFQGGMMFGLIAREELFFK